VTTYYTTTTPVEKRELADPFLNLPKGTAAGTARAAPRLHEPNLTAYINIDKNDPRSSSQTSKDPLLNFPEGTAEGTARAAPRRRYPTLRAYINIDANYPWSRNQISSALQLHTSPTSAINFLVTTRNSDPFRSSIRIQMETHISPGFTIFSRTKMERRYTSSHKIADGAIQEKITLRSWRVWRAKLRSCNQ